MAQNRVKTLYLDRDIPKFVVGAPLRKPQTEDADILGEIGSDRW